MHRPEHLMKSMHRSFQWTWFVILIFRWTGSNTNPRNNDGQGLAGTDRSNVVLLAEQVYPEGSDAYHSPYTKNGHWGTNYPMHVRDSTFLGLDRETLIDLAINRPSRSHFSNNAGLEKTALHCSSDCSGNMPNI